MNGTFSATILAGGTSKRFGKDKAFHLIESVPMWELQTRKVSQLMPSEIIISANEKQEFKTDLKIVIDSHSNEGPLRGLVDTLNATKAERMLLLAVDLPKMPINFLGELIYSGCGTIPVHKNGMTEPLAAVYPKSLIKLAEKNLKLGILKMQTFTAQAIDEGFLKERPIKDSEISFFENLNYSNI
ncbi:MAG: hypothetical protein CMO45_07855 [Verrucomicrobiales bacterium]|nr:hypothetical protein [Verrucomicrobiales bacterium]|tara:strand:- start:424 stop:978 length:555 start_codon:yes stop_codon:yes gene_type:complete